MLNTFINRNSVYTKRYFKTVGKDWFTQYCIGNICYSFEQKALSCVYSISYMNLLIKDMNIKKSGIFKKD